MATLSKTALNLIYPVGEKNLVIFIYLSCMPTCVFETVAGILIAVIKKLEGITMYATYKVSGGEGVLLFTHIRHMVRTYGSHQSVCGQLNKGFQLKRNGAHT